MTDCETAEPGVQARAMEEPGLDENLDALRPLLARLVQTRPRPRREHLSGVHSAWGHASTLTDAWRFLDVCEHASVLDAVEEIVGPDIVLWDSEIHLQTRTYLEFVADDREGRYWPCDPKRGAVVLVAPQKRAAGFACFDVQRIAQVDLSAFDPDTPLYVIRYMSAASRFVRDPRFAANRACMQEQPLINYEKRPLWLVRGRDLAGNDFVTGFSPTVPCWAGAGRKED